MKQPFLKYNRDIFSSGLNITLLLLALVPIAMAFFGSPIFNINWGFNSAKFLTPVLYYLWPALCLVTVVFLFLSPRRHFISDFLSPYLWGEKKSWGRWLIIGLLLAMCIIFRFQGHFFGDGYLRVSNFAQLTKPIFKWYELGGTLIPYFMYLILTAVGLAKMSAAILSYQLVSLTCAPLYLLYSIKISEKIAEPDDERIIYFLIILFSGFSLYFFGMVENMPQLVTLALIVVYFKICLITEKNKKTLISLWIIFLLGLFFNILFVTFLPVVIYLTFRFLIKRHQIGRFIGSLIAFCIILAGVAITYLKAIGNLVLSKYILFWAGKSPDVYYGLFSPSHLIDIFNLMILFVPMSLVFLFTIFHAIKSLRHNDIFKIFGLLIIPQIICLFILDPADGMARDIDIFGFFLLGFILLGGFTYLKLKSDGLLSGDLFMSIIPVALIIVLPMFLTHLSPTMAKNYLDIYLEKNETKIESGFYAYRDYYVVEDLFEEAARQEKAIKAKAPGALESQIIVDLYANSRVDEAFEYSLRLVDRFPYRAKYRMQKGNLLKHYKRFKDAEDELKIAILLDKYNPEMYHYLSELYRETGRESDCIRAINQALEIDPQDILILVNLAGYYFRLGKLNSLDSTIQVIISLDPEEPYAYLYNGLAAEQKGQNQKALRNYEKFISSPTDFPEKEFIRSRIDKINSKTSDSSAVE